MKRLNRVLSLVLIAVLMVSCQSKSKYNELDLMAHGVPIKIKAPENAVIKSDDIAGLFKDVTVKSGDDYYVQITSSEAFEKAIALRVAEELETVKKSAYFSKVVEQNEKGFVFEKLVNDTPSYDFRVIRLQGNQEYVFQTGLIGSFGLEAVQDMFKAVQE